MAGLQWVVLDTSIRMSIPRVTGCESGSLYLTKPQRQDGLRAPRRCRRQWAAPCARTPRQALRAASRRRIARIRALPSRTSAPARARGKKRALRQLGCRNKNFDAAHTHSVARARVRAHGARRPRQDHPILAEATGPEQELARPRSVRRPARGVELHLQTLRGAHSAQRHDARRRGHHPEHVAPLLQSGAPVARDVGGAVRAHVRRAPGAERHDRARGRESRTSRGVPRRRRRQGRPHQAEPAEARRQVLSVAFLTMRRRGRDARRDREAVPRRVALLRGGPRAALRGGPPDDDVPQDEMVPLRGRRRLRPRGRVDADARPPRRPESRRGRGRGGPAQSAGLRVFTKEARARGRGAESLGVAPA
mmetsp:Transcript_27818/g.85989  ORF Transcript_27818/g.85989 Transcript_27818/m.85989 type:complete len:364 (+) Transcript_27818:548-1639(+)